MSATGPDPSFPNKAGDFGIGSPSPQNLPTGRIEVAALLAILGAEISVLTDLGEILHVVGRRIGGHLFLSGCVFAEIDDKDGMVEVIYEWRSAQVPPTVGKYRVNDYFTKEFQASCRAGATFVVSDTETDPRTSAARFGELEIGSLVSVPVLRHGVWRSSFSVHRTVSAEWEAGEVVLLTQIAFLLQDQLDHIRAEATAARLAAIVEFSKDSIISQNLDGMISSWNKGATELYGYTENEMIGKSITLLIPEDRAREEEVVIARIRRGESLKHYETVRRARDGRLIDISLTVSPIFDIRGLVVGASKIGRDITERKQIEQTLRESNQRMTLATRATGVGIWEWNILNNRVQWDGEMFRIYGIDPTQDGTVPYEVWRDAVLPEELEAQEALLRQTIEGHSPGMRDFRIRKANTLEIRHIQLVDAVRYNHLGQAEWVVGTNLDVTDSRRATRNAHFLASVTDDLAHFSEVDKLILVIGRRLAKHLEGERSAAAHDEAMAGSLRVIWDLHPDGGRVLSEDCDQSNQITQQIRKSLFPGQVLVMRDTSRIPDFEVLRFLGWSIGSLIACPVFDHERLVFVFSVIHPNPQDWRDDEIELVREVAGRLWTRVERSRADESLARAMSESEQQRRLYHTVLSNTPDLIYVFDLDHRFVYANEALLRMWGMCSEDAVGKTCLELGYEPWHAAMHDQEIDYVVVNRKSIRGEVPFVGTQGRRIYDYIFVPVLDANGMVGAVAGTTRDISERKQAEAAQAAERKVFERIATRASLVETLDTLLLETEAQSENGIMCAIQLMDKSGRHLVHGAAPSLPAAYNQAIDGLQIGPSAGSCGTAAFLRAPVCVDDIANDPRWMDYRELAETHGLRGCCSLPIMSLEGDVLGTVAMYYPKPQISGDHDKQLIERARHLAALIIERKHAEAALAEQTAGLLRADRNKNEFLAMLAHELRNPLATISHAAEILRSSEASGADGERAQELIARQAQNMSRMIDDLMDVSRITEGKIELRRQTVELRSILIAAAETARHAADANGQNLTVSLPAHPVYLHGDPTRLEQMIGNLLGNASKYCGIGGNILLAGEVTEGAQVEIRVADDGIGIDPELMPRIFDLFVQSSRALDRSHGGLGIGLTVVDQLVKLHGGTLEAHSPGLGQGAEFVIRLPVLTNPLPASGESPAAGKRGAKGKSLRILIVDDNADAAETMALLQQYHGHETRVAHTGPDAVKLAADFIPDLVLMDIGLPEMDGYEVSRRIRAIPEMKHAFLIAVTGYDSEADRRKSQEAGFDEHLSKPADLELLRTWIDRLC